MKHTLDFLKSLNHPLTEVRILTKDRYCKINGRREFVGNAISGYYTPDHYEKLVADIQPFNKHDAISGIYVTLQEIDPALEARASNRLTYNAHYTTADTHVKNFGVFPIDIDSDNPAGTSASDAELAASKARAATLSALLSKHGIPHQKAMSGNGWHLLIYIDKLACNTENIDRFKALGDLVAHHYGSDIRNYNPSRIWKLYGTWACKGDDIPDRPHRASKFYLDAAVERIAFDTLEQRLHSILAPIPVKSKPSPRSRTDQTGITLEQWLDTHKIAYTKKPYKGTFKYQVDCPHDPTHTSPDAWVTDEGGAWQFACSHNSCRNRSTWQAFKEALGIVGAAKHTVKTSRNADANVKEVYRGLPVVSLQEVTGADTIETRLRPEVADAVMAILTREDTFVTHGGNLGIFRQSKAGVAFEMVKTEGVLGLISRTVAIQQIVRRASNVNGKTTHYLSESFSPQAPKWVADDILNNQDYSGIPEFKGIVSHPYLYQGTLMDHTGFHKETGYLRQPHTQNGLERPRSKAACLDWLKNGLLCDFPFTTDSDFENALAVALTLLVRSDFDAADMSPLFAINAASPGTGKSELAMALTTVALGAIPAVSAIPDNKEEIRKTLFTNLLEGKSYCIFDNVDPNRPIDSGMLASIVSQPKHTGRILNFSKTAELENRMTCLYSGNNIQATPELVDRGVLIQLESPPKRSAERDFKNENLSKHILAERPRYLGALVYMIENWIAAGHPKSNHRHRMRHWAKTVGGILAANGLGEHFLDNTQAFRLQADAESPQVAKAFSAIYAQFGDKPWTIEDVFTLISYKQHYYHRGAHHPAEGENLLGGFVEGRDDKGRARSAGIVMKKRIGQTLNGLKLENAGTLRNRNLFQLVRVQTDAAPVRV